MAELHPTLHLLRPHLSLPGILLRQLQEVEDPAGGGSGPLHLAEALGDLLQRSRKLPGKQNHRHHRAHRQPSFYNQVASHQVDGDVGQGIAIVGPTGAGKTTIVNLLMGFYDISAGEILIDGRSLEDMNRDEARELFAMVLQETWLFRGTVAENVAYGRPQATREEIVKACDEAYCDHFIRTLPQGYDTVVGDESATLSGGQKQLLTIARAVLTGRRLLILDEATSNVDTRTEILIQKAMDKLMRGRTCFVIAHRLSTIVNADRILVINNGDIEEQGTHQELLAQGGFYASLYASQYDKAV